ncbi:MAG: hypothetical protein QJR14_01015 [Bacillota bacterium]|nr:hypothetical protein [Bacillota bacterium]
MSNTSRNSSGGGPGSGGGAPAARPRPHALLLVGPEEATERAARAQTQRALCERGEGCGRCASCRRLEEGAHPDWLVVEPPRTGSVGIDEVHRVIRWLSLQPLIAARRVALFRQADRLSPAAQNALLKVLEEPPGDALLLLASALPDRLLPTVRSRCGERRIEPGSEARDRADDGGRRPPAGGSPEAAWLEAILSPGSLEIWQAAREAAGSSREEIEQGLGALEEVLAASFREPSPGGAEAGWPARLRVLGPSRRLAAARAVARAQQAVRANVGLELVLDVLFLELRRLLVDADPATSTGMRASGRGRADGGVWS